MRLSRNAFLQDRIGHPNSLRISEHIPADVAYRRHAANQVPRGRQSSRTREELTHCGPIGKHLSSYVAEKLLIPRPDGIAGQIRNIYPFRRDVVDVLLIKVCP